MLWMGKPGGDKQCWRTKAVSYGQWGNSDGKTLGGEHCGTKTLSGGLWGNPGEGNHQLTGQPSQR